MYNIVYVLNAYDLVGLKMAKMVNFICGLLYLLSISHTQDKVESASRRLLLPRELTCVNKARPPVCHWGEEWPGAKGDALGVL